MGPISVEVLWQFFTKWWQFIVSHPIPKLKTGSNGLRMEIRMMFPTLPFPTVNTLAGQTGLFLVTLLQ